MHSAALSLSVGLLPLLLLLLLTWTEARSTANLENGWRYHDQALELANQGNLGDALPLFRAATRSDPRNPEFLNNLGVTEMRLGEFKRARTRFERALELDPDHDLAQQNIQELRHFMTDEDWARHKEDKAPHPQLHTVKRLPRLHISELGPGRSKPEALDAMDGPFILEGALDDWDLSALHPDTLARLHGDARVDFYPHNMDEESVKPFFIGLADGVRQFSEPTGVYQHVDASGPGTYLQWNVDPSLWQTLFQAAGARLPSLFGTDAWLHACYPTQDLLREYTHKVHWRMMLIGEAGAGMFNHQDTLRTASWQAQLHGRKRWHICSPDQNEFLYHAGDVDAFHPDYKSFPKLKQAECFDDVVAPGEMLFYPTDYWHQTTNMDTPTVSMSASVLTPSNYDNVQDELEHECFSGHPRIFHSAPNSDLCQRIRACRAIIQSSFDNDDGGEEEAPQHGLHGKPVEEDDDGDEEVEL